MAFKKRTVMFSIFVMCIILASSTLASAGPGAQKYYVNGYIKTTSGAPIYGASVALKLNGVYLTTVTSQTDGKFSYSIYTSTIPRSWTATVSKSGYYSKTVTTSAAAGSTTYMGDIKLTAVPPPPPPPKEYPTIGIPSYVRNTAFETTFTVSVSWNYDPYIYRNVWLWIGPNSNELTSQIMNPIGGEYQTTVDIDPRETHTYRIQATESWYTGEPPIQDSATSYSGYFYIDQFVVTEFHDDCTDILVWSTGIDYDDEPFSLKRPTTEHFLTDTAQQDCYTMSKALYVNTPHENGKVFRKDFSPFFISSLVELQITASYTEGPDSVSNPEQGGVSLYLYDDSALSRPIFGVDIRISTNLGSRCVSRYYDDVLNYDQTEADIYDAVLPSTWSGQLNLWWDSDGFWVEDILNPDEPVKIADSDVVNTNRKIAHLMMQGYSTSNSAPIDIEIHDIHLKKIPLYEERWNPLRGLQLRSGPDDLLITKNGPATEMQMIPHEGCGELSFSFHSDWSTNIIGQLLIDTRSVSQDDMSASLLVNIECNSDMVSHILTWEPMNMPTQERETADYLINRLVTIEPGWNQINIWVSGSSLIESDIIVMRGLWIRPVDNCGVPPDYYKLHQNFPQNGELTYWIPMGVDTELDDLEWFGPSDSSLEIWINGIKKHIASPDNPNLEPLAYLGSYPKGMICEVTLVFVGDIDSCPSITTLHTNYIWLDIEVDYFEGHEPINTQVFDDVETEFDSHTHGRLRFHLSDQGIQPPSEGIDPGYNEEELAICGANVFSHQGDRNWVWVILVPYWLQSGHYGLEDTASGGLSGHYTTSSGFDRFCFVVDVLEVDNSFSPGTITHELGHVHGAVGNHAIDYICQNSECVYGQQGEHHTFCCKGWHESFLSIQVGGIIENWEVHMNWYYDWYLY